jgi:hypothetical protein
MMLIPTNLNTFAGGAGHLGGAAIVKMGDAIGEDFRGMLPSNSKNNCK